MAQAIPILIQLAIAETAYYTAFVLLVVAPIKGERHSQRSGARKVGFK